VRNRKISGINCIPLIIRLEPDIPFGHDSDFAADLIKVT